MRLVKKFFGPFERKHTETFKCVSDWDDDLIWCPSQCYLEIEYKGKPYVIYLRWRHNDPWTADIIDGSMEQFDRGTHGGWHGLKIGFWRDRELRKTKEAAVKAAQNWLNENR